MARSKSSFSRAGIGLRVVVQVACVLFLFGAANYLGFNYYERWDFSRSQRFSLAEQTRQVLRQFSPQAPLTATIVFSPGSLTLESSIYGDIQNLFAELDFAARERLEVHWIDPLREPARAREVFAKHQLDGQQNVVILEHDGRTKVIPVVEMGDFDLSGLAFGEPARLDGFRGEAVLTAAFIELLDPKRARVYFVQGHGETPAGRLTRLTDFVERQNAEVLGLNLAVSGAIPADADIVFIVGPQYDFTDAEREALERYWSGRGRLVMLLDPTRNTPNLRRFLNASGVYPRNDRVLRLLQNPVNPSVVGIFRDVYGVFTPDSPYTKRLAGIVNAFLPGATQSLFLDAAAAPAADIQLRPLVQAGEEYWGELRYTEEETREGVRYADDEDTGAPVVVAASAERGGSADDRTDLARARLVVVGNHTFVQDDVLTSASAQGNLDFMVSVINRLLERGKLTGVAPRPATNYVLNLTAEQLRAIALYTLVVIPGLAALLGLIVGFRRRA